MDFVNNYYEKKGSEITKYYFAGASQVAVRKYTVPESTTLHYMIGNHLGSASVVMDDAGTFVSETRYKPWGEVRYTTANKTLPTRYTFTGQYSYMNDSATDLGAAGFGLMFYNARWYDPMTGRMIQADTIVPGGAQGLDRYAYSNNSPVTYIDPSGHLPGKNCLGCRGWFRGGNRMNKYYEYTNELQGLTPEMERTFWYFWSMNPAAALAWLAHEFGITLPPGVTWGYLPYHINDRGFSPFDDGQRTTTDGKIVDVVDDVVYITADVFFFEKDGTTIRTDVSTILGTMVHEARHAIVEKIVEDAIHRDLRAEDLRLDENIFNAYEVDADLAVYLNRKGIKFSALAIDVRDSHLNQINPCGKDAGSSNTGCFYADGVYMDAPSYIEWYVEYYFGKTIALPLY
ncbi:MAG: RHS repeat-associated core domain-containing protein [Chloroflexi bacterium]|nr:RHS repeat-associated core domain-containing protein [Chloroflexota bacterium]